MSNETLRSSPWSPTDARYVWPAVSDATFRSKYWWSDQAARAYAKACALGIPPEVAEQLAMSQIDGYVAERAGSEQQPLYLGGGLVARTIWRPNESDNNDADADNSPGSDKLFVGSVDVWRMRNRQRWLPDFEVGPVVTPAGVQMGIDARILEHGMSLAIDGLGAPSVVVTIADGDIRLQRACEQVGFDVPQRRVIWQSRSVHPGSWYPVPFELDRPLQGFSPADIIFRDGRPEGTDSWKSNFRRGGDMDCLVYRMSAEQWRHLHDHRHHPPTYSTRDRPKASHRNRQRLDGAIGQLAFDWDFHGVVEGAVKKEALSGETASEKELRNLRKLRREPCEEATFSYRTINMARNILLGRMEPIILSEALRELTSHPERVRTRYFESIINRRTGPATPPARSSGPRPYTARTFQSLVDGREESPPDCAMYIPIPGPAVTGTRDDGPGVLPDERVDKLIATNTKAVPPSPLGSDRSNFLHAVGRLLFSARSYLEDRNPRMWDATVYASRIQYHWTKAAIEIGLLPRRPEGAQTPSRTFRGQLDEQLLRNFRGDVVSGVGNDNNDALHQMIAIFPQAVADAVSKSNDPEVRKLGSWSPLDLQIELLRNAYEFEIMSTISLNAEAKFAGHPVDRPRVEHPLTADKLDVTFEHGKVRVQWRGFKMPESMARCPGAARSSAHGLPGIPAFIARIAPHLKGEWASTDVGVGSGQVDPMTGATGAMEAFFVAVAFAPLAWSNNPFAHKLTGTDSSSFLRGPDLLADFALYNEQIRQQHDALAR